MFFVGWYNASCLGILFEQQLINCFWKIWLVLKIVYSSGPEKGPIGGMAVVLLRLLFGVS